MSWWVELYDDLLAEVLLERPEPSETVRTLDFLERQLGLAGGERIFDQCCGIGSLGVPLARRGFQVVGVDLVPDYIKRAQNAAQDTTAQFYAGDAFEFVASPPCAAAFNWWTSFGYAPDDATNLRMLSCAFASLVPGGRYALDFMNAYQVVRQFARDVVVERETSVGTVNLWRRSSLDPRLGVVHKAWTYHLADGRRITRESQVRLYFPHELVDLLGRAGFVDVQLWGDLGRQGLTIDSPRCVAVARRPR